MTTERSSSGPAWEPLTRPLYRAMWSAALVSNVGTWMQSVAAAWLMTSLTTSTTLVALVQTATTLPIVFLILPAGAIGDIVDRRVVLLLAQGWMLVSAAVLGVVTLSGGTTPLILLSLTFALGLGSALMGPTWQAIQPELVSREQLPAAVALGAVGFNLARAVGPALGGLLVSAVGSGVVFLLNAATFLAVIVVVYRWRRPSTESMLPPEHVGNAVRSGLRYAANDSGLRAVLVHTAAFIVFASVLWALLPVFARNVLGFGSLGYGLLLGLVGLGAVLGALVLQWIPNETAGGTVVLAASFAFAGCLVLLASVHSLPVVAVAFLVVGACWLAVLSGLNTATQLLSPTWVRTRTLSLYMLFFQGGIGLGSVVWGVVAERFGIATTFLVAAVGMVLAAVVTLRMPVPTGETPDLDPSLHWPEPAVVVEPDPEAGPVLVLVEYRVAPEAADRFGDAMAELRRVRRRNGALRWGVFRDAADEWRFVEVYLVESWVAHLREHERVSEADRAVQERVQSYHVGDDLPLVSHFISSWSKRR